MSTPPICALMVTYQRVSMVAEALACFDAQTYPNRTLVIVSNDTDEDRKSLQLLVARRPDVDLIFVQGSIPLGAQRNIALEAARCDWTIQWDDDDWCHPRRMEIQSYGIRSGAAGVMLCEQLFYFRQQNAVSWVRDQTGIEGTILFNRACGIRYPAMQRGEDTALKSQLVQANLVNLVDGGIVYCRTYHGTNTWAFGHHWQRIEAMALGEQEVVRRQSELLEAAKVYRWPSRWRLLGKLAK